MLYTVKVRYDAAATPTGFPEPAVGQRCDKRLRRPLDEDLILSWADAYFARHGVWPRHTSGAIPESEGDTWQKINGALRVGVRGLLPHSSLAILLQQRRGVRNRKDLPHFTEDQILTWADAHYERCGRWPSQYSGPIPESPGDTWCGTNLALERGNRGLPPGSSLATLLEQRRGIRNIQRLPPLDVEMILAWADAYFERHGKWPRHTSGPIPESDGEAWHTVHSALCKGRRGLPHDSSLRELLAKHRGIRNHMRLPKLTVDQILSWADAYYARQGVWPQQNSGPIEDAPGETWSGVANALSRGYRGLPGGTSLARIRRQYLASGADRDLRDAEGKTALDIALDHMRNVGDDNAEVVEALRQS